VGLYFFYIAYVTLHHLPFRDIKDEMASMASSYERMSFQHEQLQYGQLPLNFIIAELFSILLSLLVAPVSLPRCIASNFKVWP
jgi:hypothetical protein